MPETTLMLTLPEVCDLLGLRWWRAYRLARAGAWDGRLAGGGAAGPGVYFVRFAAKSATSARHMEQVRKITLTR